MNVKPGLASSVSSSKPKALEKLQPKGIVQ